MLILRAFKTELDLNNQQSSACVRHAGAARFAYNWGLGRKIAAYQAGEKTPSAIDLHRELNRLKKGELSWMYEVSKCAAQEALRDLDRAFQHFFRRVKAKKAGRSIQAGLPALQSTQEGCGQLSLDGRYPDFRRTYPAAAPGCAEIEGKELFADHGRTYPERHSQRKGRALVRLRAGEDEISDPEPVEKPVAGVDLGIDRMAQVSDGTYF